MCLRCSCTDAAPTPVLSVGTRGGRGCDVELPAGKEGVEQQGKRGWKSSGAMREEKGVQRETE